MGKQDVAFDEFSMFYESTEKVTDRRIATNRWNYSVGIAVAAAIGFLLNWGLNENQFLVLGLLGALFLSIVASIFSYLWLRQIDDYKALNNAKFVVLNEMAPRLTFPSTSTSKGIDEPLTSFEPFLKEWEALSESIVNVRLSGRKRSLSALSASNIERFIPQAFITIFATIALLVLILCATNWSSLIESFNCMAGGIDSATCQTQLT